MYLLVKPNGSKLWQMKYRYGGKEKTLSIGQYPEISLSAAKLAREQARQQLANGVDPSQAKQEEKIQQQSEHLTFRTVAERWFTGNTILAKKPWSAGTARKARLYLEKDIFPAVGEKPIASITRRNLNDISERMEKRGAYDAAISVREWLDSIFLTAYDNEEIESNPAYRLKPSIYAKGHQGGHYPHISFEELPALLEAVDNSGTHTLVKLGIRLLALLGLRPGELRLATWDEINLSAANWSISAERMKMDRPHVIPLSRQAIETLKQIRAIRPEGHLFVVRGEKPMTDMTINMALKRLGYEGKHTAHGFRHLLSTELNDRNYNRDWVEVQLSHKLKDDDGKIDKVRSIYNQAPFLEQRRSMMQSWADSIDTACEAFKAEQKASLAAEL